MRKITILIWIVLLSQAVQGFGQVGFNKIYDLNTISSGFFNGIYIDGDLYLATSLLHDSIFGLQGVGLVKSDTNGNILNTYSYFDPSGIDMGVGENFSIIKNSSGHIVFTGEYFSIKRGYIIIWSVQGELINLINFDYDIDYNQSELLETSDGYLLGGSNLPATSELRDFVTKIDKQGNVIWTKSY
jgi:hypothetical protein